LAPTSRPTITGGAYAKARLLVNTEAGEDVPLARHINTALKAAGGDGRTALREFSWGGQVVEETIVKREDQPTVWRLDVVELSEWGPCLKGANPATEMLAAKALTDAGLLTADEARRALGLHEHHKADRRDRDEQDPPRGGETQIAEQLLKTLGIPIHQPPAHPRRDTPS
jgi:hypothetical protein